MCAENISRGNREYRIKKYTEEEKGIQSVWIGMSNDVALRMRWREALQMIRTSEYMWFAVEQADVLERGEDR